MTGPRAARARPETWAIASRYISCARASGTAKLLRSGVYVPLRQQPGVGVHGPTLRLASP
jgi:hypothetical protein